jgi:hypothetical protein
VSSQQLIENGVSAREIGAWVRKVVAHVMVSPA